ncbi:transposase [Nonomuraea sp. NPDC049421]|uniref:transposase n=1 Tax=Nonomuraea sp. NPDC049421 TaxID=3155275 RepID=UPI003418BAA6
MPSHGKSAREQALHRGSPLGRAIRHTLAGGWSPRCRVRRGELTGKAWARIEPLLPAVDGRGRPWRDHRQVVDRIWLRLRTGAPWRDIPKRYGPWQTCFKRFKRWEQDGTWARLPEEMQVKGRRDRPGRVHRQHRLHHRPRSPARGRRPYKGDAGETIDTKHSQNRHTLGRSRGADG